MRRRAFLDQTVIALSRAFVCVRLNAWADERNVERIVGLQGAHQNSCLALLAPDARGVASDDFPKREACAWGPLDFNGLDKGSPWEEVGHRLEWLPRAMAKLLREYPPKPEAATTRPILPVFPDLAQSLNFAACDSIAVVVEVAEGEAVEALDTRLLALAEDPHLVGRSLTVRLTPAAWRAALADGTLASDAPCEDQGLFVVQPDAYGLVGTVIARAPGLPRVEDARRALHEGFDAFARSFHKKDRSSHIIEGRLSGVRWKEYKPAGWQAFLDDALSCEPTPPPSGESR